MEVASGVWIIERPIQKLHACELIESFYFNSQAAEICLLLLLPLFSHSAKVLVSHMPVFSQKYCCPTISSKCQH